MISPPAESWWQDAVGYEVYIRSFSDTDGDGLGDLSGIRKHLDYLADLGIDLVWLTPFYPSPGKDHGYDVADYLGVDPRFGTLVGLEGLISDAHARDLRIVVDLVPNHTSDQHPWFVSARRARNDPYRDYYVWRDPAPDGGPPNNWVSHFGGPAWTYEEATGQYYMHLFLPEQPDLNWENPQVRGEFDAILRFWCERGVDGFRIDVAHSLIEDAALRDNPVRHEVPPPGSHPREIFAAYEHRFDLDQPGVLEIYRRWHEVVRPYGALLLGEVFLLDASALARYVEAGDGLHAAFCFPTLKTGWDADEIQRALSSATATGVAASLAWPLSSHDDPFAATRFGGQPHGADRTIAYATLLCTLPGLLFLYQGDELGLTNAEISRAEDPIATRNAGAVGRDGTRSPFPWRPDAPNLGFSDADTTWLPVGANRRACDTAAVQQGSRRSPLERMRRLLELRHRLRGSLPDEVTWLDLPVGVVGHRRGPLLVAMNTAASHATIDLPDGGWQVAFSSLTGRQRAPAHDLLELAPDETAIALADDLWRPA